MIGGDSAAGPQPVEVLERLRSLPWPVHWLRGNADRFVVMGYDGTIPAELLEHPLFAADAWTATFLSRADRDFLDGLPLLLRFEVAGLGAVLFCHATARSDEERVTVFTPEDAARARSWRRPARRSRRRPHASPVRPRRRRAPDGQRGQRRPARTSTSPGAYWLRLGPGVDLRRTAYDTEAASAHFHALGYPYAGGMLAPVDADAVARRYEEASGKPLDPGVAHPGRGPMRYVTYAAAAGPRVGVLDGDAVLDAGFDGDMVAFIAAGAPAGATTPRRCAAPARPAAPPLAARLPRLRGPPEERLRAARPRRSPTSGTPCPPTTRACPTP